MLKKISSKFGIVSIVLLLGACQTGWLQRLSGNLIVHEAFEVRSLSGRYQIFDRSEPATLEFLPGRYALKSPSFALRTASGKALVYKVSRKEQNDLDFVLDPQETQQNFFIHGTRQIAVLSSVEKSGTRGCSYVCGGYFITINDMQVWQDSYCSGSEDVRWLEQSAQDTYKLRFIKPDAREGESLADFTSTTAPYLREVVIEVGSCG